MYIIKICVYLKNKNKPIMKSIIFKSAWSIFKMKNISFSESLKEAWKLSKSGVKAYILKRNKQVKSNGIGYETVCFNALEFVDIETKTTTVIYSGARHYYDGKTFNND